MAAWQFKFNLVPKAGVERVLGSSAEFIAEYASIDRDNYEVDPDREFPNYWAEKSPKSYAEVVARLLPTRSSWSEKALMFGLSDGDSVELWGDSFFVELDVRHYSRRLAQSLMEIAHADELLVADTGEGRLFAPDLVLLERQIESSVAARFVANPAQTLREIGRPAK